MFLGVREGKRKWRTVLCKVMVFNCAYLQANPASKHVSGGLQPRNKTRMQSTQVSMWFGVALLFGEIA